MEIKAELLKPYNEQEKINFIVEQNHKLGYIIEEQEDKLVALGYTEQEKLKQAKEIKFKEILEKAYEYENKTGLVSFDGRVSETETQILHTELFNQGKFFQMVIGFTQGVLTGDQL